MGRRTPGWSSLHRVPQKSSISFSQSQYYYGKINHNPHRNYCIQYYSNNQDADDGISHLEWETVRVRFVKAGSLCRLVENLASADTGEIESTYVNVFLATYRTFASCKQVLNLLIER